MDAGHQGVIFDVDGVLVDSYQAHYQSWQLLASEIGRPYSKRDFEAGFGRTSRENILLQWTDHPWSAEELKQLDDRKEELYRKIVAEHFPAMPGAAELIRLLHASGYRIAIGSSGPPENVDLVIEQLGVGPLLTCRMTARDVGRGKPDPQVFQLAARGLDLPPGSCCVIEDAPVGIQAAHSALIPCIALVSTGRIRTELVDAELIVDSLVELNPSKISEVIRSGLREPA